MNSLEEGYRFLPFFSPRCRLYDPDAGKAKKS